MRKLLSISDDAWSMEKFQNNADNIRDFLKQNNLDGLELVRCCGQQADAVPAEKTVGRHMPFWPVWLDFWRSNQAELLRQFGAEENCSGYYCADSVEQFIANRRTELTEGTEMGIRYAVFHVCHVQFEHCYTGKYTYTDEEIVDEYIEMMNEMLKGIHADYALLFENHWFPGLTFLKPKLAMRLLEKINHSNKGFVLDISHLINTNPNIRDEAEALEFIKGVLKGMGEAANYIRTIHLNSSAGAMARMLNQKGTYRQQGGYMDKLIAVMKYVCGMDPHKPFVNPDIQRIIDLVEPEHLVYELASANLEELQNAVSAQNKSLGI